MVSPPQIIPACSEMSRRGAKGECWSSIQLVARLWRQGLPAWQLHDVLCLANALMWSRNIGKAVASKSNITGTLCSCGALSADHIHSDLIRWIQKFAHTLQVEQIGEAKVLWKRREFTTLLKVDEDERDPNNLLTAFTLIRSVSASHAV